MMVRGTSRDGKKGFSKQAAFFFNAGAWGVTLRGNELEKRGVLQRGELRGELREKIRRKNQNESPKWQSSE